MPAVPRLLPGYWRSDFCPYSFFSGSLSFGGRREKKTFRGITCCPCPPGQESQAGSPPRPCSGAAAPKNPALFPLKDGEPLLVRSLAHFRINAGQKIRADAWSLQRGYVL